MISPTPIGSRSHASPPPTNDPYIVRRGDTLSGIARQHGVSLQALEAANPQLASHRFIFPGDAVVVPGRGGGGSTYVVRRGDTLTEIADRVGTSAQAIASRNGIRNADRIYPGDRLTIATTSSPAPRAADAAPPPAQAPRTQTPRVQTRPVAPAAAPAATGGGLSLRALFDPARGSAAPGAIIIGQAEGTRTPTGGFRAAYGHHLDPGNGVANRGSFSLQNATHLTPDQADRQQLASLSRQLPAFEAAAQRAGLDPNNAQLATAYLDLYNQSPVAAARFLDQIGYLSTAGIGTRSVTELRFRSFVDVDTGARFRLPSGAVGGGGLANIARTQLGRTPTEAEVHAVIRADQSRRIRAMEGALTPQILGTPAPQANPVSRPVSAPDAPTGPAEARRFTSNRGLDLSSGVVAHANSLHGAVLAETGHSIHVTSGRRDPVRQADAMYANYADGTAPRYANRTAEAEIRGAYDAGRQAGQDRTATVERMGAVITDQVARGVFISRHLSSQAIDIRTPPAGTSDAVIAAIRGHPDVQSVGVENDHLHIQFR